MSEQSEEQPLEEQVEEWRSVTLAPYEHYQVSDLGRVRNTHTGKILRPQPHRGGYLQVTLYFSAQVHKTVLVHRLVAEAFLGPRPPGLTINHRSCDKKSNSVANLEYITLRENLRHAVAHGRIFHRIGPRGPRNPVAAAEMRVLRGQGWTLRQLATRFGMSKSGVSIICRRKVV